MIKVIKTSSPKKKKNNNTANTARGGKIRRNATKFQYSKEIAERGSRNKRNCRELFKYKPVLSKRIALSDIWLLNT